MSYPSHVQIVKDDEFNCYAQPEDVQNAYNVIIRVLIDQNLITIPASSLRLIAIAVCDPYKSQDPEFWSIVRDIFDENNTNFTKFDIFELANTMNDTFNQISKCNRELIQILDLNGVQCPEFLISKYAKTIVENHKQTISALSPEEYIDIMDEIKNHSCVSQLGEVKEIHFSYDNGTMVFLVIDGNSFDIVRIGEYNDHPVANAVEIVDNVLVNDVEIN